MAALILKPHWEALTPQTIELYKRMAKLPFISEFYLAGGTGLALRIGHRFSVDLDFFGDSPNAVGTEQRKNLVEILSDKSSFSIIWDKEGTFVANWENVGISFFRLNRHPRILPATNIDGIHVAAVEEIGAMKLAAILSRGTRKDYIDLYFILQKFALSRLFQISSEKYPYNKAFPAFAVRALAYFDDAESDPMPRMVKPVKWSNIKDFLREKALDIGREKIDLDELWGHQDSE